MQVYTLHQSFVWLAACGKNLTMGDFFFIFKLRLKVMQVYTSHQSFVWLAAYGKNLTVEDFFCIF